MADRRINNKSFIKITNKDIWNMINKIDTNIEEMKIQLEKSLINLSSHIDEDNKRFSNVKWFAGILVSVLIAVIGSIIGLLVKFV